MRIIYLTMYQKTGYELSDRAGYIDAESFRSTILIHDELHGISYDFLNEKYTDKEEWVEIAGYTFPQNSICEDTNILLDIIVTFLETGKPCEKYEWSETKEN